MRHDRIEHLEGENFTAFELYVRASPPVHFGGWDLPSWFKRIESNADIAYIAEGCGPDGCKVDLQGMAKNAAEREQLERIAQMGGRFSHEMK